MFWAKVHTELYELLQNEMSCLTPVSWSNTENLQQIKK